MTGPSDPVADRLAILELTANLGLLVDAREWAEIEALFTDPVVIDYTSLNGGEPQTLHPAEVVGGWQRMLDHLDATQHLIANQVIELDGDRASCGANVQGTHVLANASGGPLWTVGGRYDYKLARTADGWRITGLTLTVRWATGNQHIMTLAAEKGGK
ncbi:MAG TPA: nuclear transport factor 2 family protein [Acidimicrobiales bacterium]|nr:nuclear transport factor 2 family protein [Acidimicrobiales bacterium]